MKTLIIKQSMPHLGRDTKTCRAYLDCVSWDCNPLLISASSTHSPEMAAIRCAAKAFKKFSDEGKIKEKLFSLAAVEARIKLTALENGVWRAELT